RMSIGRFHKTIMLTGAGFSRNWNGFLASEFAGRLIASELVKSNPRIRTLLLNEASFEAALFEARAQGFSPQEIADLETATVEVFKDHDRAISETGFYEPNDINICSVQKFIAAFYGKGPAGYIFTTNQDLLLERKHYSSLGQSGSGIP